MRHTRGHTGNRRSHHALEAVQVVKDKETGNLRLPHRIDEVTGMYRGKQIAPAKAVRVAAPKVHAVSAEPTGEHAHDHVHEHTNAEMKAVEATVAKVKQAPRASKKTEEK